jgi:hypothetical protein
MPKAAPAARPLTAAPALVTPKAAEQPFFPAKRLLEEKEAELDYYKRRLHNSQRSGRNKVYYAMLNKYGAEVAKQYWVPPPESSSSSQDRVPKQAAGKVPEPSKAPVPKPKVSAAGLIETI